MNKGISFPEYDDLSKVFEDHNKKFESDIDIEKLDSLDIAYIEEAHFILQSSESNNVDIFRKETYVDSEGQDLRGVSGADESYNYQSSFNWIIQVVNKEKLLQILEKEKESPSEYDLTPEKAVIPEPFYRKHYKFKRRRKR
jgi:hypothetical protein